MMVARLRIGSSTFRLLLYQCDRLYSWSCIMGGWDQKWLGASAQHPLNPPLLCNQLWCKFVDFLQDDL